MRLFGEPPVPGAPPTFHRAFRVLGSPLRGEYSGAQDMARRMPAAFVERPLFGRGRREAEAAADRRRAEAKARIFGGRP